MTIVKKTFDSRHVDAMDWCSRWDVSIGEHGLVSLVDVMPRLIPDGKTGDFAIVQAARVSYGEGTKTVQDDRGLIRYLMRHRHTTPLEMVEFKFHCVMPIFVARQWIRHRTANVNEYSARYSEVKDRFYYPTLDNVRKQGGASKQTSEGRVEARDAQDFLDHLESSCVSAYEAYEHAMKVGVGREQARMLLPINVYTEWYWKIDLHNLFHFLALRMDSHAQQEIREYATAMFDLIRPIVPVACEAFLDYRFEALTLSRLEVEAIRTGQPLASDNKREVQEWTDKQTRLGISPKGSDA